MCNTHLCIIFKLKILGEGAIPHLKRNFDELLSPFLKNFLLEVTGELSGEASVTKNPPFVIWGMEMQEAVWASLSTSLGFIYQPGGLGT